MGMLADVRQPADDNCVSLKYHKIRDCGRGQVELMMIMGSKTNEEGERST